MSSPGSSKRTIDVVDTELPADSVEFCPRDESRNILVCGTYNLIKDSEGGDASSTGTKQPQTRNGHCLVYEVDEISRKLKEVQRIETAAIPDLKWSYNDSSPRAILALAESVGSIRLYEWQQENKNLSTIQTIQVAEPHVLCLSIDWNDRVLQESHESQMEVDSTWYAHEFEPWVAAWDYWSPRIVYSGGDDCKMKGWDTRTTCDSPTFVNKRFEAGVTCIQTHPFIEHMIAVGSYDNTVRLFDSRKMTVPIADVEVGGGAWRVKWNPSPDRKEDLLVACMHDGFKVVKCPIRDSDAGIVVEKPSVMSSYNAHDSLAYGVDWQHGVSKENSSEGLVASCSFYDHVLHLWSS
ncbi:WD domain, G-beta repeat protein [Ceratobasidium sp. AG-Ba]|nr:WD domain, G-beta repeat protein [Ceratobasidium sp. AG-Ba]QRW05076.1 WD domain, G-beta repeat protein [Ceratobasidium sp. AG-Ba]